LSSNPNSVRGILDRLEELAEDGDAQEEVSAGEIVDAFGTRTYGPFLLVPALLGISPIGGIPAVPTFLAAIVLLFAVQIVFGRQHLWLPGIIKDRGVDREKLGKAADKLAGVAKVMDKVFRGRLESLAGRTASRIAATVVVLLCLAIPPLELLPFAVVVPMAVVAAFGVAMIARDGLLMLVAFAGSAAAFYLLFTQVILGGSGGG
jgi:hypothetical protein